MKRYALLAILSAAALTARAAEDSLLIAGFESREEFLRWEKLRLPVQDAHQVMSMELAPTGATEGRLALKVTQPLEKQRTSWGLEEGLPRDWSGWETLAFDATYSGEGPSPAVDIGVVVADWTSTAEWKDVFHGGFKVRKGAQTCRVGIHEIGTRVDVRRIRQLTFTHSGDGPATWCIDNVRLEGRRKAPYEQRTPAFRVTLPESERLQAVLGEDFRQFQVVADGYYEPKGWEPSREFVESMSGLAFTEYSERKGSYEDSRIVLRLARDVPALAAAQGESLLKPGEADPKALPAEAGSVEFWVEPKTPTVEQTGPRTFLHAVKDLDNQVKLGFWDGDLFFEIRAGGERRIVRHWDQTIWGDIQGVPARWPAGEKRHVRVTWGPEGMYLNVDDEEVPYNVFMLHRTPDKEPEPTPYKGGLPDRLTKLVIGSSADGTGKADILASDVLVTPNGKRGARWGEMPRVKRGEYVSTAIERGKRFAEDAFRMKKFMATAATPEGTSVSWRIAGLSKPGDAPAWRDIKPGDDVPAELNKARYLKVRAAVSGDGRATPELDEWHVVQFCPPHPRIFLDRARLDDVRERVKSEPLKTLWEKLLAVKDADRGHLNDAFLCAVTGGDEWKEKTWAAFDAAMQSKNKPTEHWDIIGCEWMLGFVEGARRDAVLGHLGGLLDRGIPRDNIYWNQSMNGWRHALHRGMMVNVALAGEEGPWLHAARHSLRSYEDFLKAWMIPAFNQVGGVWPEAFGYHSYTGEGPALSIEAWRTFTGESLWSAAAPHFSQLGRWYAYSRQPQSGRLVHVNDDSGDSRWLTWSWTCLLSSVYRDPYLQADAQRIVDGMTQTTYNRTRESVKGMGYFDLLCPLVWYDPKVPAQDYAKAPRAACLRGMDWITTRSDWSENATFLAFIPYDWYGGHKQADTGSFIVSKGGELADDPMDSRRSAEDQHFAYRMKAVAHNVLYAGEPDVAKMGDGGQLSNGMPMPCDVIGDSRYDAANLVAYRDTEHYTWMAADLTGTYRVDRAGGVRRVESYTRSILFLRPDVIVVYDRVVPTAEKSRLVFLLHNSENEPAVEGEGKALDENVTAYGKPGLATLSGGKGKLFVQALLPAGANLVKRRVLGTNKGAAVDKATIWQLEYGPEAVEGAKPIDFLAIMRAALGDSAAAKAEMLPGGGIAAKIAVDGDTWEVRLSPSGDATGSVKLTREGKTLVDDRLERKIAE